MMNSNEIHLRVVNSAAPCQLSSIGSVEDVIAARVPKALENRQFDAKECQCGFELGSPLGIDSLGEAVIVNGRCYATNTKLHSRDYYQTISGRYYYTTGMLLIPKKAMPSHRAYYNGEAMPIQKLYQTIYSTLQQPFAISGFVHAENLNATAIALPPIDGRPIFDNKMDFYSMPNQQLSDTPLFIVSVSADFSHIANETLSQQLSAVLYHSPLDVQSSLVTHTHGVTLKGDVSSTKQISPELVEKTLHIYTEETRFNRCDLAIYTIDAINAMT